jgi:PKD repeat protein
MLRTLAAITALMLLHCAESSAQCDPSVLSSSVVVTSTTTINGGFDPIWVCGGDTLHSDGGFHNVYLEPGAVMTTDGGIDTIYVKEGASVIMGGGIHVIFYVSADDLDINGGIPYQYACASITFDYTNAPANGCAMLPVAALEAGDSSICTKSCISFINASVSVDSWQWTFEGGSPSESSDENPENICYNTPGVYDVTLIAGNGNAADTLTLIDFITVFPETPVPVLTQSGDTLFSSQGYLTYQWYVGDTLPIDGATSYFYVADSSGSYTLAVTDSNGCPSSALINVVITGAHEPGASIVGLEVFPNPAVADITIKGSHADLLYFCDLAGKLLLIVKTSSSGETVVNISSLPPVFFIMTDKGEAMKVVKPE